MSLSRIGKMPIAIPAGVEVSVKDNVFTAKGKFEGKPCELSQNFRGDVNVKIEDGFVIVEPANIEIEKAGAKHGLYRALFFNMVKGVSEGFELVQELVGVGYKAEAKGQQLELSLGFSHTIIMVFPEEIKVETINERGKNPIIKLRSYDKQLLGQVAAKIRSFRKPEPYKGKGIKFVGEVLRRKQGKAAGK